jgi:hypothetical protein
MRLRRDRGSGLRAAVGWAERPLCMHNAEALCMHNASGGRAAIAIETPPGRRAVADIKR